MKHLIAILLCLGVIVPSSAFAEEYVLRLGTLASKDSPWGKQLKLWKKTIQKASKPDADSPPRIKVKIHWSGKGKDEVAMMRMLKRGELEAFGGSTGAIATQVPEMAVFELCYAFDSLEQADKIIDNHLIGPAREILEKNGFRLYAMGENGFRNFATKGVAVKSPADLSSIKMRSQEQWAHEEAYRALGGNPVALPVSEVSTGLSTGNVDGFDNTALFAQVSGWHKHIDTWTVSNHIYQPAMIIYNNDWYNGLPDDLKEIVMMDAEAQTKLGRKLVRKMAPKLMENLEAAGVTIYTPSDAERKAMKGACRDKMEAVYLEKLGNSDDAKRLIDALRSAR